MGEIGSEIAEGTLSDAEIGQVIRPGHNAYQWGRCISPAVLLAGLSQVFGPKPLRADADAAMGGWVREGGLAGWAARHAASREIVGEFVVRAGIHAKPGGIVEGVGSLGAPLHATASDWISVVVGGRRAEQAGTGLHTKIGGIVAELSRPAFIDARVISGISVGLGVIRTDVHAPLTEIIREASVALLRTFVDSFARGRVVNCIIALRTDLHARVGSIVNVGLNGEVMLAIFPAEATVIIRVARVPCTGSDAGSGVILAVGVDLDWTKLRAESGRGVSPISIIADLDAGLVYLAAEPSIRAGVCAYV